MIVLFFDLHLPSARRQALCPSKIVSKEIVLFTLSVLTEADRKEWARYASIDTSIAKRSRVAGKKWSQVGGMANWQQEGFQCGYRLVQSVFGRSSQLQNDCLVMP